MAKKILRWLIALIGAAIGYGVAHLALSFFDVTMASRTLLVLVYAASTLLFGIIFYTLYGMIIRSTKSLADGIDRDIRKLGIEDVVAGTLGLLLGLLISALVTILISRLQIPVISSVLSVIVYLLIPAITVILFSRRKAELYRLVRSLRPKRSESLPEVSAPVEAASFPEKFLDTSVIIDGRLVDVMETGFIDGKLVIPSFVLEELQHIADSEDALKRQRGRRGLDVLNQMKKEYAAQVVIRDIRRPAEVPVDMMLLSAAEEVGGKVVTNDYNLNKVAAVRNIEVLNINDLSKALRPVVLPGETLPILISQVGKEPGQGVGYLNDGTMVVVENGKNCVGQELDTVVTSVLQTSAGRMIFTRIREEK